MTRDYTHIDNLIAKYLAGEILPEEEVQLKEWMQSSPDNEKYFDDLRFIHDKAVASHKYQRVNVEKAWDSLQVKMDELPGNGKKVDSGRKVFIGTWVRVAASIIVIAGLSVFLYNYFGNRNNIVQSATIASTDSIVKQTIDVNTQVVLNRNSRIIYTATKRNRNVELTGEAYFKVEHSRKQPLTVNAEGTMIEDIGTSFNVKAIPAENSVEVYVETGEVKFFTQTNEGITLRAGETGLYLKDSKTFTRREAKNLNVMSYKTKIFVFRSTRLADAISELSSVYAEHIELGNPALADCTISVSFNNEDIGYIMDIIAETLELTLEKTGSGFILQGEKCNSQ